MSTFSQRSWGRKCQQKGTGGVKKKSCLSKNSQKNCEKLRWFFWKVKKVKSKSLSKPKIKAASKPKEINKGPIKISKTYIPKDTEKYMCDKHKVFFRMKLQEWKKELVKANNEALYNGSMDDNSISADIVDQASSYTDKNVEMKAINRQIKLISEIDKALLRLRDDTYGYCLDTAEAIGLKRLMARPVAKYTITAQEKHEKNETHDLC